MERVPTAPATLLDYLPKETIFVLCEPELLNANADRYAEQVTQDDPFFISCNDFQQEIEARGMASIELSEITDAENFGREALLDELSSNELTGIDRYPQELAGEAPRAPLTQLKFQSLEIYWPIGDRAPEPQIAEAQRKEFFSQLHRWLRQEYAFKSFATTTVNVSASKKSGANTASAEVEPVALRPVIAIGALSRGFLQESRQTRRRHRRGNFRPLQSPTPAPMKSAHAAASQAPRSTSISANSRRRLRRSSPARHRTFSWPANSPIGAGNKRLRTRANATEGQECLVIEYAPNDPAQPAPKLYVAGHRGPSRQQIRGHRQSPSALQHLGRHALGQSQSAGGASSARSRGEMLRIQAARESSRTLLSGRHPVAARVRRLVRLQRDARPNARDRRRESGHGIPAPMDRLICGDVGYGKTEVAIRAAFKAVDGRQTGRGARADDRARAAAFQHFSRAHGRLSDSRRNAPPLSSRASKSKIIEQLAAGEVDIVIGTHRLVQEDVKFKDLGLVVIDEEQRFGVMHKEKFKRLRTLVDVLTLSNTPTERVE